MTPALIWILGIVAYVAVGLLTGIVIVRFGINLCVPSDHRKRENLKDLFFWCCFWPMYWLLGGITWVALGVGWLYDRIGKAFALLVERYYR
jgi:hypothetical protein